MRAWDLHEVLMTFVLVSALMVAFADLVTRVARARRRRAARRRVPPGLVAPRPRRLPDHVAGGSTAGRRTVAAVGALAVLVAVSVAVVHQAGHQRPVDIADGSDLVGSALADGDYDVHSHGSPAAQVPEVVAPVMADQRGVVFAAGRSVSVRFVARDRCRIGVRNPPTARAASQGRSRPAMGR